MSLKNSTSISIWFSDSSLKISVGYSSGPMVLSFFIRLSAFLISLLVTTAPFLPLGSNVSIFSTSANSSLTYYSHLFIFSSLSVIILLFLSMFSIPFRLIMPAASLIFCVCWSCHAVFLIFLFLQIFLIVTIPSRLWFFVWLFY